MTVPSRVTRLGLGHDVVRLETLHGLRPATTHSPEGLRARIERAVGVDRIIFASIVASAVTVWGEDPLPRRCRLSGASVSSKRCSGSPARCS